MVQPGRGIHASAATLDPSAVKTYVAESQALHFVDFLLNVIPSALVQAFVGGDILPVLLVSVLFGLALLKVGASAAAPLLNLIEQLGDALFAMVGLIVMRVAPIGAFGAMAFTIGRYGLATLLSLAKLMAAVYLTCFLFIVRCAGRDCALRRVQPVEVHPLHQGRDPAGARHLLVRVGAAADDGQAGAARLRQSVVGLVIPTGYSFNLDGTSIYMTIAVAFVAQALDIHLGWREYAHAARRAAADVEGRGGRDRRRLHHARGDASASTPTLPVAGLTLLIGVDRFMSEARAITNLIGNGVATMVVARWEGALDMPRALHILETGTVPETLTEPASPRG